MPHEREPAFSAPSRFPTLSLNSSLGGERLVVAVQGDISSSLRLDRDSIQCSNVMAHGNVSHPTRIRNSHIQHRQHSGTVRQGDLRSPRLRTTLQHIVVATEARLRTEAVEPSKASRGRDVVHPARTAENHSKAWQGGRRMSSPPHQARTQSIAGGHRRSSPHSQAVRRKHGGGNIACPAHLKQ